MLKLYKDLFFTANNFFINYDLTNINKQFLQKFIKL